jgi:hypothetical protein
VKPSIADCRIAESGDSLDEGGLGHSGIRDWGIGRLGDWPPHPLDDAQAPEGQQWPDTTIVQSPDLNARMPQSAFTQ